MKKIMFFVPYLYDGGAERAASLWANILSSDYEIYMLNFYKLEVEYPLNLNIKRFYLSENKSSYKELSLNHIIKIINKLLIEYKVEILIPFLFKPSLYAYLSCKKTNVKIINTIRNNPWKSPSKFYNRIIRNFIVKKGKYLITQTDEQSMYFKKYYNVKAYVVPNLINESIKKFDRGYINNLHNIICVGRLHKQKNFEMVIKVAKYLINKNLDFKIDIYGKGLLKNKLNKLIEKNDLKEFVELKGNIENIYEVESRYDLYLLTSKYEGFPNSLLEAMAIGLPSISTNCKTGIIDLIDDGKTGFIVEYNDYIKMGDIIIDLSQNIGKLNNIAQSGKKDVVAKYELEKVKITLNNVIQNVIDN